MRETLIYLSHLDHEYKEQQVLLYNLTTYLAYILLFLSCMSCMSIFALVLKNEHFI